MIEQDTFGIEDQLWEAGNLAGLFRPAKRSPLGAVRYAISPAMRDLPWQERLPSTDLRHYYGYKDGAYHDDLYLRGGFGDIRTLRSILARDGFDPRGERIMDFGCSAGRMIRHLEEEAAMAEVWGVDIHAAAIDWATTHLAPPFHFLTTTTAPHLPFEDRSFGLIYAGSVWTHIGALADAWLLEMRRLLRPGGRLYLTISDEETLQQIAETAPDHPSNALVAALDARTGMLSNDWLSFATRSSPWQQRVVYRRESWVAHVARWMELREVVPQAYGWQTAVLLAKP